MSKTQTTDEFDSELRDELFDFATAADGEVVTGEIKSVNKSNDIHGDETIHVSVRLPTGKTFAEEMPYPKADTDTWKFVRLARSSGYSLGSAEHMIGDEVGCRYTDDRWETVAPRSRLSRAQSKIRLGIASVATPIWLPWGLYLEIQEDRLSGNPMDYALMGGVALTVWATAITIGLFIGVVLIEGAMQAAEIVL